MSSAASANRILAAAASLLNDDEAWPEENPFLKRKRSQCALAEDTGVRFTRATGRPFRVVSPDDASDHHDGGADADAGAAATASSPIDAIAAFPFLGGRRPVRAVHPTCELALARAAEEAVFDSASQAWMRTRQHAR